ncbi:ATP phosphoribosyltransferase [bacterium SM23_31]|nr:MAG: ATP phosphoribosyltransferase [bacterium SM23_31]
MDSRLNRDYSEKMLHLGLPSGSLEQTTFSLFTKAGYKFSKNGRSYYPSTDDDELEAILLRPQEIASYVDKGIFDAGITGEDWILESEADILEVVELVYSKQSMKPVKWVVAVPVNSEIKKLEDLEGKQIATELVNITRKYLNENSISASVEFSWGATEVKVPILVDAIVEAIETGRSLKENNLRIVDTILMSTPRLIANKESYKNPWKKEKIDRIAMLMQGALNAYELVGLKFNLPRLKVETVRKIVPAMKEPTISSLLDEDWVALEIIIKEKIVSKIIPELKKEGARDIIEYPLNKVVY